MKTALDVRQDFPMIREGRIYLDTAATAHKPQCVIDSLVDFYSNQYATVNRAVYSLAAQATENFGNVRRQVQNFLGAAHSEEIIFTRGTTASLNLLARSFGVRLRPGDAIILSEIEHHSNLVPWQMIAEERGAVLRYIPVTDSGELILDELQNLLDDHVKIVSLAHISNVIGTLHPVEKIISMAHEVGAVVCLDGAQSAAHLPVNVQELDVDFYTFSGHKLYGPTGVGVLYGKRELLDDMPPVEGGGDMIERVTLDKTTPTTLPQKFEAGTPMVAEVMALGSAIAYLQNIGLETIQAWEAELLESATQKLSQIEGLQIIGTASQKGAIISFIVEGVHPLDLATLLDCRGIAIRSGHHCCQPAMDHFGVTATARVSFGIYNTLDEIDQLITTLQSIITFLR